MANIFTNKDCLTCAYWSGIRKVDGISVKCTAGQRGMCAFHQTETKDRDSCGDYVNLLDESKAKRNLKYKNQTRKSSRGSGKKKSLGLKEIAILFVALIVILLAIFGKKKSESDPDMTDILKQSIENNVEISKEASSFISNNEKLFKGNVKLKAVNKKVKDSISVSKYCKNADSYKDTFVHLKNAKIDRGYQSGKMYAVKVYYDESAFVHHCLHIYFYYKIENLDYGDSADIYAYSMTKETDYIDESMTDDIESGEYSEYLVGSYVKKTN